MSEINAKYKEKLLDAVEMSGFDFEYFVQDIFRKEKWTVLNNRYYIDDVSNIEREIDAIAYKAIEIGDICYYTALIISCKKTKESDWVFLTQKKIQDVNFDYSPLHIISSDFRLKAIINNERSMIIDAIMKDEFLQKIYEGDNRVFANFQFNGRTLQLEENRRIYDSISTTIKTLEAEKESHRNSMINKKATFYCFYAISVFNNKLIEVLFEDSENKSVQEVNELKYVNRHIVYKKDQFYLVHFACKDYLADLVKVYNKVFESNTRLYSGLMASFYDDIWSYEYRVKLINGQFMGALRREISMISIIDNTFELPSNLEIKEIDFQKTKDLLVMTVHFDPILDSSTIELLNKSENAKKWIGAALKRYFKYDGTYSINQDWLPF